tara:strand:- start:34 stop:282 length:249 start_codon:yes stop_codon:yes gene_type:complete
MIKTSATFLFENNYVHHANFSKQKAIVKLHIDYLNETYDITPSDGSPYFNFKTSSHLNAMWKAVIDGIDQAIDFANKELKNK